MTCRCLLFLVVASACVAPVSLDEKTSELTDEAETVVVLTFDDTFADNFQVGDMARARGLRAVFFVNSTRPGTSGYMTRDQLLTLQRQGHEIAGHTLTHANLTQVSEAEARSQVCNDRAALMESGFMVTSFAYPFAANNTLVNQIIEDCGYNSARDVGGLRTGSACVGCPYANPIPPPDPYVLRTNESIDTSTTLATMQEYVLQAERNGGGLVPIVFHHVCNGCNEAAISPALLGELMDWLAARAPSTQVGTMQEVIGGSMRPAVRYPPTSGNLLQNGSLEVDANANQIPDCWTRGAYGTNAATYTLVNDAFDGNVAQRIQMTSWSSGGRRLVSTQDTGTCAPRATPGRTYTMTAYYKANTQPRFSVYYRNSAGSWVWFAQSALQPTSTTYRQASYTTPPLPSGATHISIGLTIFNVGTITVDAHTLVDTAGGGTPPDTTAPALSISCNGTTCATSPYASPVDVVLVAADVGGVSEIRYTTNGSDPTNGTLYTGPFTVSASATVRATAVDFANNRANQSAAVTVQSAPTDTTPPALSIACNGSACATTAYPSAVNVSLTATDAGGIREIRYTTNGSDPINGTLYTGPFVVSTTSTVRATAVDNAGNRTNQTATITIQPPADTTPPAFVIACNNGTCSTSPYPDQVTVSLQASDTSGIAEIRYTLDGSDPATGAFYTAPFTLTSSANVRAVAADNAGNRTNASAMITVQQTPTDTTSPALQILCNGSPCGTTAYESAVTIALTASDASGIREIRYTTDGSDPTNGNLYTGTFALGASATVRAIAVDNVGNARHESAQVTINPPPSDTTPPVLSIACNGSACAATTYASPVTVSLTASDASGIAEIRYTTNGSDPTTGTLYAAPFTLNTSATVRATTVDNAGNRTNQTATISIATAPANMLQNASLELDSDANGIPNCWKRDGYGTNTAVYTLVSDAFDGSVAQRLDITSWSSGGRRLASAQDTGACAPSAVPGRRYTMTARYKSNIASRFSVYVRGTSGAWRWFAESAPLPTASAYALATYTSPALPADATAISIGLSIFNVGSITTDAYTLVAAP